MKTVALGEPNSEYVNSGDPVVNGFAFKRMRSGLALNSKFSMALAPFRAEGKFSVP